MPKKENIIKFGAKFDFLLYVVPIVLAIIGLVLVYSATLSLPTHGRDMIVQGVAVIIGIVMMTLLVFIDYDYYRNLSWVIMGVGIALLVIVLLVGQGGEEVGTKGWIRFGPVGIQPSEFVKIAFILSLGKHISTVRDDINSKRNLLLLFLHYVAYVIPVFLQPDWGTAFVFTFIFLIMMFFAGVDWKYFATGAGLLVLASPIIWFLVLDEFQKKRFMVFLYPESDPAGGGYQVMQSKIAIGSGQMLGNGFTQGTQTQMGYLPQARTDFIFSVAGEEFGFFGCMVIILLFALLIVKCIINARGARDSYGEMICIGVTAMFLFHIIENIGMTIGILPVTGIPLPFLSYGGSNVITSFMAVGLILGVRMRRGTLFK